MPSIKSLFCLSAVLVSFSNVPWAASTNELLPVEAQLKAAVLGAQARLGPLEPWQKSIFLEEVVPQFQRFIRDYRASSQGLQVDIDFDSLRRYLIFYAPRLFRDKFLAPAALASPTGLGAVQGKLNLFVMMKFYGSCQKCSLSAANLQQQIQARASRRGLGLVWLHPEDFPLQMGEHLLFEKIMTIAHEKGGVGGLLLTWGPAPEEDADSAHADEKRYLMQASLQMQDIPMQTRQKELMDNDSFEFTEGRLMTDLLTDLGTQLELQVSHSVQVGQEEILIEVGGIKDFNQYSRIKASLQSNLKNVSSLDELKFTKSAVVFSLVTHQTAEEIKKQLAGLSLDPGSDRSLVVWVR